MKLLLYVVLFCAMFCCALTGVAPAATPFDDFSGNRLDSSKWYGRFWNEEGLIMVREVTGGKLVTKIGGRTDDNGIADNTTGLIPSEEVTSFSAKVSFVEGAYDPTVDDNDMYGLFAELSGFFYKATDGDVSASIGIRYQENNQGTSLEIAATVYTQSGSQIDAPQFTTTITPGQEYTLTIAYDKSTNTFTFSVNDGSQTESHDVATGPARSGPADGPGLYLGPSIIAAGNIIGGGYVHATFDDVMINGSLYDDFTNAPLDGSKWIDHEIVREIRDNRLQMNVQNTFGEPSAENTIYIQPQHKTNYLQADVNVSGDSVYNGDAYGMAAVYGSFYNTKHDGTGYQDDDGEIYAGTTLSQDANGQFQPQAWVGRCNDKACDSWTTLYWKIFSSCQVQPGTPITFSVEKREADSTFIFHCNQDKLSYQLTAHPLYAPNYNARKLKTSVKSNGNGTGYIKATFDNVFVKKSIKKSPWNLFLPAILTTGAKK